ncbi:MAG: NUDIX hydrolase [Oscillospiraceae bacterium]|nr:NUDIX hydrolase [Oscillospiraceae bacterium]
MKLFEKQIDSCSVFEGRVIKVRKDTVELPNGATGYREVVAHPGAVAVLPIDEKGNAVLVRQYRYAMGEELLEAPAGKLEKGEDPLECAKRELSEETGCTAGQMIKLGCIYSSPGFTNEKLHLYLALDLTKGEASPDEDEFLNTELMALEELRRLVIAGEIHDSKTVAIVLLAWEHLKGER